MEKNNIPTVILTEQAVQVFQNACLEEGKNLSESYLRIGAKPGGCSGYKYELEVNSKQDIHDEDLVLSSNGVQIIVKKSCLLEILGPVKIDYSDKNLVEQGFIFEQLINGHQCGCGESFTPVRDLENRQHV